MTLLAWTVVALVSTPANAAPRLCEGPDVDPWVADFRSRVESAWDPDAGRNASASFIYLGEALVGVRVSMAL